MDKGFTINGWMVFWAIASPILAAIGAGLLNFALNSRAKDVKTAAAESKNKEEHERIEVKVDGLGNSFDKHKADQQKEQVDLARTLGDMNAKLTLLVAGKIDP